MDLLDKMATQLELHSVEGIRACFAGGLSPNAQFRGEPLIYWLLSEYKRGPRFKDCVQAFVDHGLNFEDKLLLSVLLDDAASLDRQLKASPSSVSKKYTLRCAYTPLLEASLLHICAEFNHLACARVLTGHGLDIDVPAGHDGHGFGGQTPVFHTVNQNRNQSADMLHYLLEQGADLGLTVAGLVWGKGYDWETFIPAVNPVSYAQMGLLPQMHRDESTVAATVSLLMKHGWGIDYTPANVPCRYLKGS